ncbi:hypothetical protein EC988_001896 [Linderina pennispora]|nr:hypothetical protein EC988_001896 [Linderina pennispora]
MDELFNKIDAQVDIALGTLFPVASQIPETSDAQQRAQDFSAQVTQLHGQLLDIKQMIDALPNARNDPEMELHKEIQELTADIQAKNMVLEKHKEVLRMHAEKLRETDLENRRVISGK